MRKTRVSANSAGKRLSGLRSPVPAPALNGAVPADREARFEIGVGRHGGESCGAVDADLDAVALPHVAPCSRQRDIVIHPGQQNQAGVIVTERHVGGKVFRVRHLSVGGVLRGKRQPENRQPCRNRLEFVEFTGQPVHGVNPVFLPERGAQIRRGFRHDGDIVDPHARCNVFGDDDDRSAPILADLILRKPERHLVGAPLVGQRLESEAVGPFAADRQQ